MSSLKLRNAPARFPAKLGNAVLFNLSWIAIVMTHSSVIALAIVVLHLAVHFVLLGKGRSEAVLVAGVTLLGAVLDQLLFLTGVFTLAGQPALAPFWLACLWPVFATSLMHAFEGLQHRPSLAAVVGAVGGALSYFAGARLTAVEFSSPLWGPTVIALLWAVLFPLLLKCATRLSRHSDPLQSWEPAVRRAFD